MPAILVLYVTHTISLVPESAAVTITADSIVIVVTSVTVVVVVVVVVVTLIVVVVVVVVTLIVVFPLMVVAVVVLDAVNSSQYILSVIAREYSIVVWW